MRLGRALILSLVVLAGSRQVAHGATSCSMGAPDQCTIGELGDLYYQKALGDQTILIGQKVDDTERAVEGANRSNEDPAPFGTRFHNSYQDFLNLLSFAINSAQESDNGKEFVIRFNPIHQGMHRIAFSLTLAQPEIADPVKNAIPAAGRDDVVAKLQDKTNDTDNRSWSLAYTFESEDGCDLSGRARCWGRSPVIYRQALSKALTGLLAPRAEDLATGRARKQLQIALVDLLLKAGIPIDGKDVLDLPIGDLPTLAKADTITSIKKIATGDAKQTLAEKAYYERYAFDALQSLIDNQPQLAITASYHTPGKYGGPKEDAASLELQWGRENLNSLARSAGGRIAEGLEKRIDRSTSMGPVSTDKFVLSAAYKRIHEWTLDDLGLDTPVPGFTPIDQKRSSEYTLHAQYGRQLPARVLGRLSRFDLSADGIRATDDGVRTKDRFVAVATVTVPVGYDISIPVSVTWANKPEFLGEQKRTLGLHLGFTYRLPWDRKEKSSLAGAG